MVHQEDNEALQQRLNSKTNEMFELRRQLDRALELAREQDLAFAREKEASAEAEGQLEKQGRGPTPVTSFALVAACGTFRQRKRLSGYDSE
jgi:hypothetical protein